MSYRDILEEGVAQILSGAAVPDYVEELLESANKGWWPAPGSRLGRPLSDEFWEELLKEILLKIPKNKKPKVILKEVARTFNVSEDLVSAFLDQSGLLGAFEGGTLDDTAVRRVLDAARTGSGIWTAGSKNKVLGTHSQNKTKDSKNNKPPTSATQWLKRKWRGGDKN